MKKYPFYYMSFRDDHGMIRSIADQNSHPFIFIAIEKQLGKHHTIISWQEITQEEYEFYLSIHSSNT